MSVCGNPGVTSDLICQGKWFSPIQDTVKGWVECAGNDLFFTLLMAGRWVLCCASLVRLTGKYCLFLLSPPFLIRVLFPFIVLFVSHLSLQVLWWVFFLSLFVRVHLCMCYFFMRVITSCCLSLCIIISFYKYCSSNIHCFRILFNNSQKKKIIWI